MKKIIAMLAAAAIIVAAAGCVNKVPQPDQTTETTVAEGETLQNSEGTHGGNVKITQYTTRKPSPSRITSRPTTERTTPAPIHPTTVRQTTPKPTTTKKPVTTASSYTAPVVEYGGTLGTEKDSVRIRSHDVSLSQNNTFILNLKIDILTCSGTTNYIYIGFDCYDAEGNKINEQPVRTIVSVRPNETQTISIATAPFNTAKVVFRNV